MNEPKTPNLGLNKIDRSSPSTTYFDLDKYLDQNWEKVDEGVGQVEEKAEETAEQVSSIQERLDTEKRRSVTLEPGLQIINAERASAFKLEGLKGRTLVNLLGRDGGFEGYSNWGIGAASATLDTTVYAKGSMSSLKVTLASTNSNISKTVSTSVGKTYVLVADVKNVSTSSTFVSISTVINGNIVTGSTFGTSFAKFTATASTHAIAVVGGGASGQVFNADNVRLYEISAAEYAALNSMTPDQVAAKYPYVDSVQPVRNPYAIRYGENLLPPFYEWDIQGIPHSITSAYEIVRSATDDLYNGASLTVKVPVIPGNTYTLNYEIIGDVSKAYINWSWNDKDDNRISWTDGNKDTVTAVAPNEAVTADVRVTGTAPGTFTFKNPMLTLGTTVKPFKPGKDDMFALQTELYANPLTGANADEVFEKNGQYFKLKKWEHIVLNGEKAWAYSGSGSETGIKVVYFNLSLPYDPVTWNPVGVKYDGKILTRLPSGSDRLNGSSSDPTLIVISISNANSGWGDSYTPTTDEIKAYFMGWVMTTQESWSTAPVQYNGTGTKGWVRRWLNASQGNPSTSGSIGTWVDNSATPTVPTTMSAGFTPYQLLYQIATPTVEPITSEGQLTFIEGDNQVEVGTGIVLREATKPALSTQWSTYEINSLNAGGGVASNPLKYKAKKVMTIYKNGLSDKWERSKDANSYGLERAYQSVPLFDSSAAYSVTYLMMDTSPVASFVGSVADNEKALLMNLTDTVQQNVAALSMLKISIPNGDTLKNYVDNKPWQKYKITQDNGSVIQLAHSSDLNNIKTGGQYDCFNAINGPGGVANAWFYVEVLVHSNAPTHVIQRASRLDTHNTPTLYMRTCMDNIWSAWSPDVFQSGVNAKNGIVDAVNAIGGSASMNDTWSTLASKIKQIKTGKQFATGQFVIGSNGTGSVNGLAFKPRHITFANATNTPNYIYYGIYSEESPRNNYGTGGTRVLNRVVGLDNGLSVDDKIIPTVSGFNVSGTGITDQRTYNYFATE